MSIIIVTSETMPSGYNFWAENVLPIKYIFGGFSVQPVDLKISELGLYALKAANIIMCMWVKTLKSKYINIYNYYTSIA